LGQTQTNGRHEHCRRRVVDDIGKEHGYRQQNTESDYPRPSSRAA
jgi:hypothetical protein